MSDNSQRTVLVTGANGYIGARTVEAFLQAGYSVRAAVRSSSRAAGLVAALSQFNDRLSLVEVPDITVPGAFDDAVRGVTGIAHLASAVSLEASDPEYFNRVAVDSTKSILDTAAKEASVETFVMMSSILSMIPPPQEEPIVVTDSDWNDWAVPMVEAQGSNAPGMIIYGASKVASEKAFWKFREENNPKFNMVSLNPVFVGGPPLIKGNPEANGTNSFTWKIFNGADPSTLDIGYPGYVDIRDVARMTVFGIDKPHIANGQRYLLSAGFLPPQAAADILRKGYPDRRDVIKEGRPHEGYSADLSYPPKLVWDGSKAVKDSGVQYISLEKTVLDTAKDF